ncbi:hypothetical protein AMTR_s00090p00062860 [Amborella trichopoda]|uniref:Uncharacterized protein n=1 Tax=Amborella trichopoda TaxID=13333 RepID=W1P222_AMBTC|nr:hypothetical protein AMTR_s00090p00062860 [Amborella trichopoda]
MKRVSKATTPTPSIRRTTMGFQKKMRIIIEVDTPSPTSPALANLEVEAPGEEYFISEEHLEATSASDHEEGMIDALRGIPISPRRDEGLSSSTPPPTSIPITVEEVDHKEDKIRKAKGNTRMVSDKLALEVLNVPLAGCLSGSFLTQAKVIASTIAALQSLPWGSLSRSPPPSSIEDQTKPINMNKSPLLVADLDGEVVPPTTVHTESPKTDATNDALATLANTTRDLVRYMMKDPPIVSEFQRQMGMNTVKEMLHLLANNSIAGLLDIKAEIFPLLEFAGPMGLDIKKLSQLVAKFGAHHSWLNVGKCTVLDEMPAYSASLATKKMQHRYLFTYTYFLDEKIELESYDLDQVFIQWGRWSILPKKLNKNYSRQELKWKLLKNWWRKRVRRLKNF